LYAEQHGFDFFQGKAGDFLSEGQYALNFSEEGCVLCYLEGKKLRQLQVSFVSGAKDHRRKFGGGKGQAIAKAVGLGQSKRPLSVLDATAGQGGDAFVLASLGCHLTLVERSPVARALLVSALEQGKAHADLSEDQALINIFERMHLLSEEHDVVYLDPMFPERKKSALVKKEMRVFHDIIGADADSDGLLEPALALAEYRVVVKRPNIAPFLGGKAPEYQLNGKACRFDIYVKRSIKARNT